MSSRSRHRRPGPARGPESGPLLEQRHGWVDAGRGLAIVLVVLVHSRDWLETAGLQLRVWQQVNDVVSGLRMPLFFTISGLLGAKWVTARWSALLSHKVAVLVWVYLLWQPIGLASAMVADRFTGAHQTPAHFVIALAATVVRPRSELWFLWALAVYFVLVRLTARSLVTVQLVLAGVVSAVWLSGLVPDGNLGWNGVPKFYAFFLVGAHHRQLILWLADSSRRSPWRGVVLIAGWAGAAVAMAAWDLGRFVGPGLVDQLFGLAAGVALAGLLARGRLLTYLGARTLPIYLAHTPLIVVLAWMLHRQRGAAWVHELRPVLPVLVTVAVVPLTLALHTVLKAGPARILYAPPRTVTSIVQRICAWAPPARRVHLPAGDMPVAATTMPADVTAGWLPSR